MISSASISKLRLVFIAVSFECFGVGGDWHEDASEEQKNIIRKELASYNIEELRDAVAKLISEDEFEDFDDEVDLVARAGRKHHDVA